VTDALLFISHLPKCFVLYASISLLCTQTVHTLNGTMLWHGNADVL
jgi:hypothetical protein